MRVGRDHWEFNFCGDGHSAFYDGTLSASNAYEARWAGWSSWLRSKGVDLAEKPAVP
jgi:hypothetical protein